MVSTTSEDNSKTCWNNPVNLWEIKDNNNDLSQPSLNGQFLNDLKNNGILPESHESFLFARSRDIWKFGPQFRAYKRESISTSYLSFILDSLVVVQEFSLSCLLLAAHRIIVTYDSSSDRVHCEGQEKDIICLQKNFEAAGPKQITAMAFVSLAFVIILLFSEVKEPNPNKKFSFSFLLELPNYNVTLLHRLTDASLIAATLRLLSAVLRTLTASYSLDTVMALSVGGMIIHFFSCDYMYANGYVHDKQLKSNNNNNNNNSEHHHFNNKHSKRSVFYGGTVSLNSSLFSTTLLASRISSNVFSYAFLSFSVVIFAFYPAVRHALSRKSRKSSTISLMGKCHRIIYFQLT